MLPGLPSVLLRLILPLLTRFVRLFSALPLRPLPSQCLRISSVVALPLSLMNVRISSSPVTGNLLPHGDFGFEVPPAAAAAAG